MGAGVPAGASYLVAGDGDDHPPPRFVGRNGEGQLLIGNRRRDGDNHLVLTFVAGGGGDHLVPASWR